MFNLGSVVSAIDKDRRGRSRPRMATHTNIQQRPPVPQPIVRYVPQPKPPTNDASTQTDNESNTDVIDMDCVTRALNVCDMACNTTVITHENASCDTSELEQKEKERKALAAFQKRIAEQKVKAAQMKAFLGTSKQTVEDIEDE